MLLQATVETGSILSRFIIASGTLFLFFVFLSLFLAVIVRQGKNKLFLQAKALEELEKQLLHSQIEVQEATFATISKELHDNVGQLLSSAKLLLGVAKRKPENFCSAIEHAEDQIGKAITAIRTLSKTFDSEWLQQFSLIENLNSEINRVNGYGELWIQFQAPATIDMQACDQIILFRMIQEGLHNVLRHAGASNVIINIEENDNGIEVMIKDDGKGMQCGQLEHTGMGIKNIKARAVSLGGEAVWNSNANGTNLTIKLNTKTQENDNQDWNSRRSYSVS
jgi:signal transduction histidine kinase